MPKPRHDPRAQLNQWLAARQRAAATEPARRAQAELAKILDGLNAFGALETLRMKRFNLNLCHGPKPFDGLGPPPWVGVLIWHRAPGYYGFKTLTLIGVWALRENDTNAIIVGSKRVGYSAPTYNPESYHTLMRRGFDLYYDDDGSPPPESGRAFTAPYDAAERLTLRGQIEAALHACVTP